jgi:hypothetical protein
VTELHDVELEIAPGELLIILGPFRVRQNDAVEHSRWDRTTDHGQRVGRLAATCPDCLLTR